MTTTQYIRYPAPGGGSGITTYATFADFPASAPDGTIALALDTDTLYAFNTGLGMWLPIASPSSVLSIGTIDSVAASANGASISGNDIIMQSASISDPGLVNNTTQSFSGVKTFTSAIDLSGHLITSVLNPVSAQDAATKNYVDTAGNAFLLKANNLSDVANKATSFNNLSPMTTSGDIIYGGASGAGTRLGKGADGQVLTLASGLPSWATPTVGTVTSVGLSVPAASIFGVSGSPVTSSGTLGLTLTGTSGGIPYFNTTSTLSSSALLTANALVLGGGAGTTPSSLGSLGTTTTVLHGNAAGAPTFGAVVLTTDVSGILPVANGGTGTSNRTLTDGTQVALDWANRLLKNSSGTSVLDFSGASPTFAAAVSLGSHKITSVTDPTSAQDAATKNYVDSVASGLNPIQAAYAATVGSNLVGTYSNGVAGVGATFTITATGAFTLDGTTPPVLSRILLKDQTSGFQNGVYDLTVAGTTGVSPILTRSLDYNTASSMNAGDLIPVINGTVNGTTSWLQTATITTVGTDSLVFVEWTANPAAYLLKANNLSDVANKATSFNNLSPMTTSGDIIYGGASGAGTRLAKGSDGQVLTLASGLPSWAASSGGGVGNLNARFVLNDSVFPFTNIGGPHYQYGTQSLTQVFISMFNSGTSGSTVIQVNQYRSGSLQGSATASLSASSGNPSGSLASLSGTLSLVAGDIITVDVNSVALGLPESLAVEY